MSNIRTGVEWSNLGHAGAIWDRSKALYQRQGIYIGIYVAHSYKGYYEIVPRGG